MIPASRAVFATALLLTLSAALLFGQGSGQVLVGRNVQVSQAYAHDTHYEVLAAADPRDATRMIIGSFIFPARGAPASSIVYTTRDGGATWQPTLEGDGLRYTSDPAPAYGPDGTAYYTASLLGPPPSPRDQRKMLFFRSPDGGLRWEAADTLTYSDRQYVVVDGTGGKYHGRVYVNGNNRVPYGISDFIVFTSTDRGRTFQGPGKRADFGKYVAGSMGNAVVMSDGTLIGVFGDGKSIQVIKSIDGGESLLPAVTVDQEYVPGGNRKGARNNVMSLPVIAIDHSKGVRRDHLYAVWADRRSGRTRIYFSSSADKGATWSETRRVDDGPVTDTIDHFMPTMAVNRDGVVGVMWYDRRDHPDNMGWDVRITVSLDGGQTFLPSVRVSEQGTSFGKSAQFTALRTSVSRAKSEDGGGLNVDVSLNSFMFLGGDTNGLVADAHGVFHPVWVDNRTGVPQIWTAPVTVQREQLAHGADVSDRITLDIGEHWYDRASETLHATVRLHNNSAEPVHGPFRVQVIDIRSDLGEMSATGADNGRTDIGAEWSFGDAVLAPDAKSQPHVLRFTLSNPQPFRSGDRYRLGLLRLKVRVMAIAAGAAHGARTGAAR
jgi:hypothetical protein